MKPLNTPGRPQPRTLRPSGSCEMRGSRGTARASLTLPTTAVRGRPEIAGRTDGARDGPRSKRSPPAEPSVCTSIPLSGSGVPPGAGACRRKAEAEGLGFGQWLAACWIWGRRRPGCGCNGPLRPRGASGQVAPVVAAAGAARRCPATGLTTAPRATAGRVATTPVSGRSFSPGPCPGGGRLCSAHRPAPSLGDQPPSARILAAPAATLKSQLLPKWG